MTAPDISLILLAYNQQDMVAAAAQSCLAQQGEPIEIILSDDASSDATHEVLCSVAGSYQGSHRVRVNRNPKNLGIGAHLNRLVELASGQLLVVAAGDDLSLPQRVVSVRAAWEASQRRLDLIASPLIDLSPEGVDGAAIGVDDLSRWRSAADWVRGRPHVVGAAHAWTRRLFERFGPLSPGIAYEDQVLAFRAIVSGGALTLAQPLVRYRRGGTSARPRGQTAGEIRSRMAVQCTRHLADTRQLLADARTAGCEDIVGPMLQKELERQRYLHDVLSAGDPWQRVARLFAPADVSLSWRWRKFASVSFAGLTAWRRRLSRAR